MEEALRQFAEERKSWDMERMLLIEVHKEELENATTRGSRGGVVSRCLLGELLIMGLRFLVSFPVTVSQQMHMERQSSMGAILTARNELSLLQEEMKITKEKHQRQLADLKRKMEQDAALLRCLACV